MRNSIVSFFTSLAEDLFAPPASSKNRWLAQTWAAGLFIAGAVLWIWFFNKGNLQFNFHDWAQITGPRFLFLKDALLHHELPLHISGTSALGGITDRYMSIPDAFLGPQMILLLFLSIGQFIVVNQVIMYALGFLGLLWFRNKYSLSPVAFTALFLLFNFNGHIVTHLAVGHATWGGYYLFPWFAMLIITLLEGDRSWSWVARMSLLLFFMLLNGSFHQFVWSLLFLGLLAVTSWKHFVPAAKALVFTTLVALIRLLPPSLLMTSFGKEYSYLGGYASLNDLWQSLVALKTPPSFYTTPYTPWPMGWWEYSLYLGLVGAAFLLFFGLFRWLRDRGDGPRYYELALPLLGMAILSLSEVFVLLRHLPLPLLDGERVVSRVISLPFVFLLVLAAIEFQRWLDRTRSSTTSRVAQLALIFVAGHDLWQNFREWRVPVAANNFLLTPIMPSAWFAVSSTDPDYIQILNWGALGTAGSLLLLALLVWLEGRGFFERPVTLPSIRPRPGQNVRGGISSLRSTNLVGRITGWLPFRRSTSNFSDLHEKHASQEE